MFSVYLSCLIACDWLTHNMEKSGDQVRASTQPLMKQEEQLLKIIVLRAVDLIRKLSGTNDFDNGWLIISEV